MLVKLNIPISNSSYEALRLLWLSGKCSSKKASRQGKDKPYEWLKDTTSRCNSSSEHTWRTRIRFEVGSVPTKENWRTGERTWKKKN